MSEPGVRERAEHGRPKAAPAGRSGAQKKERPITVIGAIVANLLIAAAKFVAAAFSGSSAMLTEGIHSLVDTGNEVLLLIGISRSQRRADRQHPLGYGMELYFWSLIVAVLLFGFGGGFSIYEGVHRLEHPTTRGPALWNYVVLGISFFAEGASWAIATHAIARGERGKTFWKKLHHSKDPSKFMVFGEDTAALLGILVALAGVALGQWLDASWPDAVASIIIGGILCLVAVYLVYETKNLLIGEGADPDVVKHIHDLAASQPGVRDVRRPATVHLAPDEVLLILNVRFEPRLSAEKVAATIDELERTIKSHYPEMRHILIEAQRVDAPAESEEEFAQS